MPGPGSRTCKTPATSTSCTYPRTLGTACLLDDDEDLRVRCGATTHPRLVPEVFVSHANALLTPNGRVRLAKLVVDSG